MKMPFVLAAALLLAGTARAGGRVYGGVGIYVGPWWAPPTFVYEGPPDRGFVDCDVDPEDARVFVDGKEVGEADDFDGYPRYLTLRPGHRRVEFRHKGYETLVIDVDLKAGWMLQLDDKMDKGDPGKRVVKKSGPPPRSSSYDDEDRGSRDRSDQYKDEDSKAPKHDSGKPSDKSQSDDYEGYEESDRKGSSS